MPSSPLPDQRHDAAPAAPPRDRIVLAVAALLLAVQISPWYYSQRDAAAYFSIARHLAHGEGLSNMGSPVLWFPPGYPLLISPLFRLRDMPLLEISIVQWLLAVALLWGIYRWARPLAPEGAVWIAAISVGTNAVWIHYRQPISELAFMAAMAWLLVSLQALARPQAEALSWPGWLRPQDSPSPCALSVRWASPWRPAAAAGCSAGGAAPFSRRPAAEVISWRRALARRAGRGRGGGADRGGVILHERWAAQHVGAATYLTSLETRRGAPILENYGPWLALVVSDIGRVTVPFMFKSYGYTGWWWDVNMLVYVPLFGLLLYGFYRWVRHGGDPLAWSLPFYLAVLTYFRWESGGGGGCR